ncbi:MAG: hypothetical protein OEZ15_10760 [Gammaproteobacteria bacterium]|nr:hypothetical protein [Gammaproteobacteria bacterium]
MNQKEEKETGNTIKHEDMREIAQSVEKTMADFLEAMKLRDELSVRIGRRTTQIIRVGAGTVSLLSLAIMYLTASLNTDMKVMSNRMDEISVTMKSMDTYISSVPQMANRIDEIALTMNSMDGSIKTVPAMATAVGNMSRDVNIMSQQLHFLNGNVGAMGRDVDRMSAPMRMFPMP